MQNRLLSDLKFSRFLAVGRQLDPLMPTDPLGVHVMMCLAQVYRRLGADTYGGVELIQHGIDVSKADCLDTCVRLAANGLITIEDGTAFRLTDEGLFRVANIEDLRERSLSGSHDEPFPGLKHTPIAEPIGERNRPKKKVPLYIFLVVLTLVTFWILDK